MEKVSSILGKGIVLIVGILVCTMSLFMSSSSLAAGRDEIIMSWRTDANTMDVQDSMGLHSVAIMHHMYDGLLEFDPQMKIQPWLAESYETKDSQTWTFKLRKGVKFHDGTPFNAEVVRYNFNRMRYPDVYTKRGLTENGGLHRSFLKEVKIIDDYTVQIVANFPYAPMPYVLSGCNYAFLSPTAHQKYKADYNMNPVGTGPYKFVSWRKGERLIMERNDEYWRDRIQPMRIKRPKRIVLRPISEDGARVMALEAGEVDVITHVPVFETDRLRKDPRFVVYETPSMQLLYIGMNQQVKPFDDKRVRQALIYAVNREDIVKRILQGHGSVPHSVCPPKVVWSAEGKRYEYNPAKAKELLAQAGYPNGFKSSMICAPGSYPMDREWTQIVLQNFRDVGVEVELKQVDFATLSQTVYAPPDKNGKKNLVMYLRHWATGTGEAHHILFSNLHSTNKATGANMCMYENPEVDRIIEKGIRSLDPKTAAEYFAQAQRIIMDDAVWIPLIVPNISVAWRKDVHNIAIYPYEPIWLRDAYIE